MPDSDLKHGFITDSSLCKGCMECMRVCPTQAIRVKAGKASYIPDYCIDCGLCLRVCTSGAISATTLDFEDLDRFKFKVAVPSASLYSQFPVQDSPAHINQALLKLGFDKVWDSSIEIEMGNRALKDCVRNWQGSYPLISSNCPVIVRLVQVAYPTMVNQLIPIESPRELAARALKRRYSQELGLAEEEIGAIYITPCQTKTISILQPAEDGKSDLDGAIGVNEIYNEMLGLLRDLDAGDIDTAKQGLISTTMLDWGTPEGQIKNLPKRRCLALTGLANIINVFDDIEKGKIRDIEFLECHVCHGGCVAGNLMVDNPYLARSKLLNILSQDNPTTREFEQEVERRYPLEDFTLKAPLKPRELNDAAGNLIERVKKQQHAGLVLDRLPGLNCGLCGAPSCKAHAEDVASNKYPPEDCVLLSRDRVALLQKLYLPDEPDQAEEESDEAASGD